MKIMFYYASMHLGGAERMIATLANNFAARGDEVAVMVNDSLPTGYPLDGRVRFINQNAESDSHGVVDALRYNLRRVSLTRKYFREIRPDVVLCFAINNLTFTVLARPGLGIKAIGSDRNNPTYSEYGFWEKLRNHIAPQAEGFIFQTQAARSYYPHRVQERSVVIPNGIAPEELCAQVAPLDQRIKGSISAVGRLEEQKGFDTLIRAFALFRRNNPGYTLTIFGEGSERPKLEGMIAALGLTGQVILAGRISNVFEELSRREIFVLSSRFEGMPNALMEGLACGCACISTDCDYGPNELIQDGLNGLLIPVDDEAALAAAMERLARDPDFAQTLAKNALQIRETHSMENIAQRFYDYITATVRQNSKGR